jgi:hypothetical protein
MYQEDHKVNFLASRQVTTSCDGTAASNTNKLQKHLAIKRKNRLDAFEPVHYEELSEVELLASCGKCEFP